MSGLINSAGSKSGVIGIISQNIAMASGKGLNFGATADSSGTMTGEVFSDYEEGTWTMVPNSGSITGTTGHYIKVGTLVTLRGYFHSATGYVGGTALQISGLPYTPTQGCCGALQTYAGDVDPGTYNLTSSVGTTGILTCIESRDEVAWHTSTWSMIGTGHFFFTITYMA